MSSVIRRSPIVIVWNFLALEVAGTGLYALAGRVGYYARIWRELPVVGGIPFTLAQIIFILAVELGLVMYIFFRWYRDTALIQKGQLVHHQGILRRQHTTIGLDRVGAVTWEQGILGRLVNYGSVIIRDRSGAVLMRLDDVAEPREFANQLGASPSGGQGADPLRLVMDAEHERLERKSTLRWDVHAGGVSRALERSAMKTIAAFMNSGGGHLLLGIADDGSASGLEKDFATLTRKDADGWENHFSNILAAMIGPSFRQYVQIKHFEHQNKPCALVAVSPSPRPAYLVDGEREEFFVRTGNGTTGLKMSESHAYITSHFK